MKARFIDQHFMVNPDDLSPEDLYLLTKIDKTKNAWTTVCLVNKGKIKNEDNDLPQKNG